MSVDNLAYKFLGLSTIHAPFTVAGFTIMAILAILALFVSLKESPFVERLDRSFFWAIGTVLVVFAVLRPIGLGRDDYAYVDILKSLCPMDDCTKGMPIQRDYVWYGLAKLGLSYRPVGLDVALLISGFGVFIKLFVLDRLCRQRLLALLLYIPLCYVQYDLTQLRAGLAISWMMFGLYWLLRDRIFFGSALLWSNFIVHSQAVFSPGLLTYNLFKTSHWVLPVGLLVFIGMIYGEIYPSTSFLNWLGLINETAPYYAGVHGGGYVGVRVFPVAYLLIVAYGAWLCFSVSVTSQKISWIVSAGLLMGVAFAWFFAIIPTMQTRIFEFYAVPLALLAGNLGKCKIKVTLTALLALMLYFRLELLHDWILG